MSAEKLRRLINADEILLMPSVFNALTASLAESIGFEGVALGGNLAGAMTGATEPMITMSEMCEHSRPITKAIDIPLMVDGDAGFGDAAHTYRTIQEFAHAGIAAIHIEDQVHPKRMHYHEDRVHLVEEDVMVSKVEAAVQAREDMDRDIVIVARSDAGRGQRRQTEDETIEDAVDRVNRYVDAGADAGMLYPADVEEAEYAANHVEGPQRFGMVEYRNVCRQLSLDDLRDMGYEFVTYPLSAQLVTVRAMEELYESIYNSGEMILDSDEAEEYQNQIKGLIDLPMYYDIETREGKK